MNVHDLKYPKRPPYFAQKVIRLLVKTAAAQELGQTAALLVVIVATTEDAARYRRPVSFFNSQLMMLLGIRKWDTLDASRKAAVKAGWLCYEPPPSGKRKPGLYWANIPVDVAGLPDTPVDEAYPQNGDGCGEASPQPYPKNGEGRGDGCGEGRGDGCGDGCGEPPDLVLDLHPTSSSAAPTRAVEAPEGRSPQEASPKPDLFQRLMSQWNAIEGVRPCRAANPKRRTALSARLREKSWRENREVALQKVAASSFCRGHGERNWVADIDWFLRPGTVLALVEGKYDDRRPGDGQAGTAPARALPASQYVN